MNFDDKGRHLPFAEGNVGARADLRKDSGGLLFGFPFGFVPGIFGGIPFCFIIGILRRPAVKTKRAGECLKNFRP